MTELEEYQKAALKYAVNECEGYKMYLSLGLCGEAGEVAEKVKKVVRDKMGEPTSEDIQGIAYELGDCLWYLAVLADRIGYSLQDVAVMNIDKIRQRAKNGTLGGSRDNR